jgi:phosphoserine phosphatase RsbU/P
MLGSMNRPLEQSTRSRLRYNVLLEPLSDAEFAAVEHKLSRREFRPGEPIILDESYGEEVFFLVQGRVRIVKTTTAGDSQMLAMLHPGDCFGEMEVIAGRPRAASVVAVDPCETYSLAKADFEELLHGSPGFAYRLLQVLSIRVRSLNYHFIRETNRKLQQTAVEFHKLEQLIDATRKVNSTLDLNELLDIILDMSLEIVECERGTVYLVDEQANELWTKVSREFQGTGRVEIRLPIGKGIAGYVAATGDLITIPDAYMDPRFNPEFDKQTGFRTRSILCMPMRNKDGKIIGVFQLFNKRTGEFSDDDGKIIDALSVHASLAIENARLYAQEREKIRMEGELKAAREVQMSLLPKTLPRVAGYDFAAAMLPAEQVAGDLHDFIELDDRRLGLCLGDVSGKGLPASLLMAHVQATMRDQAHTAAGAGDCVGRANALLYRSTGAEKFVTLFYGILDRERHLFTYSNAGHEQPFLVSRNGDVRRLGAGGVVLGIMETFPFEEESVALEPGDTLVVFSDGVTDSADPQSERFGEHRLKEVLQAHTELDAGAIRDAIMRAAVRHAGSAAQADDMTLMVVKRLSL